MNTQLQASQDSTGKARARDNKVLSIFFNYIENPAETHRRYFNNLLHKLNKPLIEVRE